MSDQDDYKAQRAREVLGGRLLLLGFGVAVLSMLVAIDHVEWFSIRPATGTSIAMSNAAGPLNSEAAATQ